MRYPIAPRVHLREIPAVRPELMRNAHSSKDRAVDNRFGVRGAGHEAVRKMAQISPWSPTEG